jgi:RNA polymerase sigma factor (sigma-70 family)
MLYQDKEKSDPGSPPEATLFRQAQAGEQESVDLLLRRYERLVHYVVIRQQLWGLTYEEAVQAGRQGLWRAILNYDLRRGTSFTCYAYGAIMHYVWAAVQSHLRRAGRETPLGVLALYFEVWGPDPAWLWEQGEVRRELHELVARLPDRLRRVVVARYGLDGEGPRTLRTIGDQLGLTGERVRQLQLEALIWLRQPAHSQELRALLARHTQEQYELAEALAQFWLKRRGGRHGR